MSLVTTCPACGISFHVKPEQLAPSRGDVRCGQCGQVFNALQFLAEAVPAPAPSGTAAAAHEVAAAAAAPAAVRDATSPEPAVAVAPAPVPEPAQAPAIPAPPAPQPTPVMAAAPPQAPVFRPTPARGRAGRRRVPAWLLAGSSLLLLLLAFGQSAYFLRSEIAVRLPRTKPYLQQACAALGCRVELPRNAQLLSIDDSDLQEHAQHKDVLILSSTIVNHAEYAQAYPVLELTLTDIHERPVLRRLLQPQEYLPKGTDLQAGIAGGGEIRVRLPFTTAGVEATGYRVYVTYP